MNSKACHLRRIELTDFRCFPKLVLDLDRPLTMISGANATGKSSIGDAIEWCLTGRTRGTDDRGAGSKWLVRSGATSMRVQVAFGDGRTQTRVIMGTGTMRSDPVEPLLDRRVLRALVDGGSVLDLSHVDAKMLLMGVLDVHVPVDGELWTLAQVDAAYQDAFEGRRQAKAALNALVVPPMPSGEVPVVAELQAQLDALRAEAGALERTIGKDIGRREQLQASLAKALKTQEMAIANLEALHVPDDIETQIQAFQARLHDAADVSKQWMAALAAAQRVDQITQRMVLGLTAQPFLPGREAGNVCVLHPDIPCHTSSQEFSAVADRLRAERDGFLRESDELAARVAANEQAGRELDTLKKLAGSYTVRSAIRDRAIDDVSRLQKELAEAPPDIDVGPQQANLEVLRERIRHGERVVLEARELIRRRIAHEDVQKARDVAAARLQIAETRVEYFGPKGARVEALRQGLGGFHAALNSALEPFGYQVQIELEPWDVVVNGRSADLLSRSERMRVGLALSCALASSMGAGFVILDGADILDDAGREALSSVIDTWTSTGGQILVTATRSTPIPSSWDIRSYWLEKGADGTSSSHFVPEGD